MHLCQLLYNKIAYPLSARTLSQLADSQICDIVVMQRVMRLWDNTTDISMQPQQSTYDCTLPMQVQAQVASACAHNFPLGM